MKKNQLGLNSNQLPMALQAKQEVARFQSSLLDLAGIPVRHNIHSLGGHTSDVRDLALTPDGKRFVTAGYDHTARLWDLESGRSLMVYRGHNDSVRAVAVSPDGEYLATGSADGCLKIWDLETGNSRHSWEGHSDRISTAVFSPDGLSLYSGGDDCLIKQWSSINGAWLQDFRGHSKAVWSVAVTPDGKFLLSASNDGTVRQWNLLNGECVRVYQDQVPTFFGLCLHPNMPWFYAGGGDGVIREWDLKTGVCRRRFTGHTQDVDHLVPDHDGVRLVSSSFMDETVRIWDLESGACVFTHGGPSFIVDAGFFGNGDGIIFCASQRVTLLERKTGNCLMNFDPLLPKNFDPIHHLCSFGFSPSERILTAGSRNGEIFVWDVQTGRMMHRLAHPIFEHDAVMKLSISRNEKYLFSGDYQGRITVWDLQTGTLLKWFRAHLSVIYGISLTGDNSALITCGRGFEDNIRAWDFQTILNTPDAELLRISRKAFDKIQSWKGYLAGFWGHEDTVLSMDLSPDGRLMATGSGDRTVKIWDLAEGLARARNLNEKKLSCTHTVEDHPNWILTLRFSHDGRKLVSGCNDGMVRVFDLETGKLTGRFSGCEYDVYVVDFAPDDQKILAGCWDRTIKVWDLNSGGLEAEYRGNDKTVYKTVFVPDGTGILVCGEKKVRRWEVWRNHLEQEYSGCFDPVLTMSLHPRTGKLAVGGTEGRIKQLDLRNCRIEWIFKSGTGKVPALSLSAYGNQLITADNGGMVDIKDISSGDNRFSRFPHPKNVKAVWMSPSGRALFTAGEDGVARCWDTWSRQKIEFRGHEEAVNSLAVNRGETLLYTAGADGTIRCWDILNGTCLKIYQAHTGPVNHILLSWDEKLLYSGGRNGKVKIWDLQSQMLLSDFGIGTAVTALVLHDQAQVLVTGGADGSIKAWDPFSGALRKEFSGHDQGRAVSGLGFNPNEDLLISADGDGSVRFWNIERGELLVTFHNLDRGFLWTTPPDAVVPFGWFWTDRPELINILNCNGDGSHPQVLTEQDPVRQEYLKMYNNREMVVNRLNHYQKYRKDLLEMNQAVTRKQVSLKPAEIIMDQPALMANAKGRLNSNE